MGLSSADTTLAITVDDTEIADNAMILDLWLKRGEWVYSQSDWQHYYVGEGAEQREIRGGYIIAEWQTFISRNGENLKRMLDALYSEYNPIENYSMKESGADGEKEDSTETSPTGTTTTTQYGAGVNSVDMGATIGATVTGYDNAKSTVTPQNAKSMDFDNETHTGFHKTHEHFFKRAGNIGTTTSMQMIAAEISERKKVDLIAEFVARFFAEYCYFVG